MVVLYFGQIRSIYRGYLIWVCNSFYYSIFLVKALPKSTEISNSIKILICGKNPFQYLLLKIINVFLSNDHLFLDTEALLLSLSSAFIKVSIGCSFLLSLNNISSFLIGQYIG